MALAALTEQRIAEEIEITGSKVIRYSVYVRLPV